MGAVWTDRAATPTAKPAGSSTIQIAPSDIPAKRSKQCPASLLTSGTVALISVGDGDTIRVSNSVGQKATIRLACIDAPETAQGYSGTQSTAYLKALVAAGSLEIRPQTVDRYGRTVAEVVSGGRNVNLELDRAGMAYAHRDYLAGCDAGPYLDAESQAARQRLGVWRYGGEQRPWDFRKTR